MATIKEIAKLAETSISSVSRVINNSGYVREEVRVRIQKVLDETGYRPNALAKALHSKKSQTIGVILPKINATSSGENVAGIDAYYSDKGYSIILGNTNHNIDKELEFIDLFAEKQVDGIILIATTITKQHEEKIAKIRKPLVIMGQQATNGIPSVIFDEIQATEEMMEHLVALNHQRISLIGVSEDDVSVGQKRKQGYLNAIQKHALPDESQLIAQGDFSVQSGYQACEAIFTSNVNKPDAVFAVNDKMAIGAINYLLDNGFKIPQDVSVAGVGGGSASAHYNPKITSLVYDFEESGRQAAELLHQMINDPTQTKTNHTSFVPYYLAARQSTALKS